MAYSDLLASRLTFGPRFLDPDPPTASASWLNAQLAAPAADDPSVLSRLALVQLPITITDASGESTSSLKPLGDLFLSVPDLWSIPSTDPSANHALSRRAADEVAAARYVRAAFSPWQLQEVMVDFWHNHFSVDAYQTSQISVMWPAYDQTIRANALGNFRSLLGAVAKSASMMFYLNQNASLASHPNENFAREVMELHTLGIASYLGETTPAGLSGTGYSDQDVIEAARLLTGWTIGDGHRPAADGSHPNDGVFLFSPRMHDFGAKSVLGRSFPAGAGQDEGETFLDMLASHPGTAAFIATKLYVRFIGDAPPAGSQALAAMAASFQANAGSPGQIAQVLKVLVGSAEFAASGGAKIKTPFEFLMALIRGTGAEIAPLPALNGALSSMGAPLFHWPTPNGMPDVAAAWTGTNDMIRRWSLADQLVSPSARILADGPGALFTVAASAAASPQAAASFMVQAMIPTAVSTASLAALANYAGSGEVLGAADSFSNPVKLGSGMRRLAGAVAALPEFQVR